MSLLQSKVEQRLGKVSSSTRPTPQPFPSPPLLPPSLFFSIPPLPFLPLPPLFSFPLPLSRGSHSPPQNSSGSGGGAVSSPVGSRAKPQPKNDLVHIWAKNSSSGGNSFVDLCKNKMGKMLIYSKLIINKTNNLKMAPFHKLWQCGLRIEP